MSITNFVVSLRFAAVSRLVFLSGCLIGFKSEDVMSCTNDFKQHYERKRNFRFLNCFKPMNLESLLAAAS